MREFFDRGKFAFGFSDKSGGVSSGAYESLNLALHVGDDALCVEKNREILQKNLGVKKLVFMEQIHSDKVCEFSEFTDFLLPCDAIWTSLKNVALCVMVADCAPILVFDHVQDKIAAIHAGRAGVMQKIFSKCCAAMNSRPNDLEIFVGAHICVDCYEVGDLDLGEFSRFKNGKNFDISRALEAEFTALGVENYHFGNVCNHCDENYFSYRRDGVCGRFCGFIFLKDQNV